VAARSSPGADEAFGGHNTEAWVPYLGATRQEFDSLRELVSSHERYLAGTGIPLVIVDQSEATRREMWELGSLNGPVMLPVHERQQVELEEPDLSLDEIRDSLDQLASSVLVRVQRTSERLFHSECINAILKQWSKAPFVLHFDSDSLILRSGLIDDLVAAYPVREWSSITATGMVVDGVDSTRQQGLRQRAARLLQTGSSTSGQHARRFRLPRLHPYCMLLNRELIQQRQIDFRLLFLDVLEQGWTEDPLCAGRLLGDTGSSLMMQSAYHGLRVGDFPMDRYVSHAGRSSHRPDGKERKSLGWW